jgi:hypothetical protein
MLELVLRAGLNIHAYLLIPLADFEGTRCTKMLLYRYYNVCVLFTLIRVSPY